MIATDLGLGISEQLLYNTVRINTVKTGNISSLGTGFYFSFSYERNTAVQVIITNRHVIDHATNIQLVITEMGSDNLPLHGQNVSISVSNSNLILFHKDPKVDLALIFLAPIVEEAQKINKRLFYICLQESDIITKDFSNSIDAIQNVLMVGYPVGLWDSANNLPLVRHGITATHINVDYQNLREFLIDMSCHVGSSGSPVFYFNPGMVVSKSKINSPKPIALLGILYATHLFTMQGDITVVPVPTEMTTKIETKVPINIGRVIKANRIFELKEQITELLTTGALKL